MLLNDVQRYPVTIGKILSGKLPSIPFFFLFLSIYPSIHLSINYDPLCCLLISSLYSICILHFLSDRVRLRVTMDQLKKGQVGGDQVFNNSTSSLIISAQSILISSLSYTFLSSSSSLPIIIRNQ